MTTATDTDIKLDLPDELHALVTSRPQIQELVRQVACQVVSPALDRRDEQWKSVLQTSTQDAVDQAVKARDAQWQETVRELTETTQTKVDAYVRQAEDTIAALQERVRQLETAPRHRRIIRDADGRATGIIDVVATDEDLAAARAGERRRIGFGGETS